MDIGALLRQTWNQFTGKIVKLILFFLVGVLLSITVVLIPCVLGGMIREFLKVVREGKDPELNQLWSFENYGQIALFLVVGGLLIMIGFLLFVVPGILFAFWWMYSPYFIVDRGMDFWSAMGASRQLVVKSGSSNNFKLLLIIIALNILGSLGVGAVELLTGPFNLLLLTNAYVSISKD